MNAITNIIHKWHQMKTTLSCSFWATLYSFESFEHHPLLELFLDRNLGRTSVCDWTSNGLTNEA